MAPATPQVVAEGVTARGFRVSAVRAGEGRPRVRVWEGARVGTVACGLDAREQARTVRGTATSGHVQKNASYVKPEFYRSNIEYNRRDGGVGDSNDSFNPSTFSNSVKVNAEVMEHNRKRKIEGQV